MGSLETYVRIIKAVEDSGGDWISNPWFSGGFVAQWTGTYELRKVEMHWSRTPTAGVVQDDDICTFHFLNLTGGNPDASWTTSDYTTVETALDAMWASLKVHYMPEIRLSSYVWRADGPAFKPHGTSLSPTLRITARALPGTASGETVLPPQCALSVTEATEAHYTVSGVGVPGDTPGTGRTQTRNRWGRFYLPSPSTLALTDGRFTSSYCGLVSGYVQTAYNACVTAGIVPVVYSPTTGNAWSVTEVHVDDIVDVIRSRRYVTPLTRAVNAVNAA
jgi:hypothetical protein